MDGLNRYTTRISRKTKRPHISDDFGFSSRSIPRHPENKKKAAKKCYKTLYRSRREMVHLMLRIPEKNCAAPSLSWDG